MEPTRKLVSLYVVRNGGIKPNSIYVDWAWYEKDALDRWCFTGISIGGEIEEDAFYDALHPLLQSRYTQPLSGRFGKAIAG